MSRISIVKSALFAALLCCSFTQVACDGDDGESTSGDSDASTGEESGTTAGEASSSGAESSGGEANCDVDPLEGQCEAYVTCMTSKCADAYAECYGDLLDTGVPGGVCGDWLNCAAACDCDDDACKQACEMDDACTQCNTATLGGCAVSMCAAELATCGG